MAADNTFAQVADESALRGFVIVTTGRISPRAWRISIRSYVDAGARTSAPFARSEVPNDAGKALHRWHFRSTPWSTLPDPAHHRMACAPEPVPRPFDHIPPI
jgi:hypothetical protein